MTIGGVREVDRNGRVQIPSEIRDLMSMDGRKLNVYYEHGKCIIEVIVEPDFCRICGLSVPEGDYLCKRCKDKYVKGEE